ncbi:unnamed protein product [Lactuca virosa]|uniref:Uncharacterized protein n=1 Tax=Lactuca virosa TaxID=75947 RepID=A0AAU9N4Y8_9ASTR|nr:unnamed protein product [Lactuca virosa]
MWQGGAHGEGLPQGIFGLLSLQPDCQRKAKCPQLTQGSSQASAPAALRVTDGRPGKAEAPKTRRRAFQLTMEEFRTTPDVVAGTFIVIFVPTFLLFDSGASRSFVSLSFSRHISVRHEALSRPLRVSIIDEHAVFATDWVWIG